MKKKVLKGSLIAIVLLIATICGLFAYSEKISKIEVIENAKNSISKLVADATADGETSERALIEVKDISKPQTIGTDSSLKEIENITGKYQFNITGCGVAFSENDARTNTGFSHIPICKPYEKPCTSHEGNSSGAYLDESYNKGGKIYKAYLLVEMAPKESSYISEVAKSPITLLYGGKDGNEILSGIESTCTYFYYNTTCGYQGTGWIDVTDFIKENGYGWYYGCNIPYGKDYNDMFSSWKLIVIEEKPDIPVRKLSFAISNEHVYNNHIDLSVGGNSITTKKEGIVTGQLMYAATEVDITDRCCNIAYSMNKSNFKSIETTNGVRTTSNPLCMIMSRNGVPLINRPEWTNHYYYTKKSVGSMAEFVTTNSNNYPEATGDDFELLDIDGSTDKNNIVFENNKSSVTLRFGATSYWILPEFLGIAVDIDVPEYTSTQTSVGHDTYYATINGTITNTSTSGDGMGMHDGKAVVTVDKGLKILSTNAYFTTASGEKINLTEDMYTINEEDNTITYIFGKDSNGKNLNGESLTYTVETECLQGDNVDGKKYTANNEVYANGKLINNNVETDHYMEKVVWDKLSVTIENPPFDGKTREANYTVEYYKDGEVANTETIAETIPELQTILTLDKTQINLENKYNGYTFEKIEIDGETVAELPNEIEEGKIIKVYYKLDELVLNTTVNLTAANGHGGVDLDWSTYDATNKIFKAYQRKDDEEGSEYESISTVDFYKEIEPIKVLNVYPTTGVKASFDQTPPSTVFTYSDGTTATLPKSALMKIWMEGGKIGNDEYEPYAINPITGQKILDITPVSSTEFGNNPKMIWNYDVVAFGTWNGNGDYDDKQYDKGMEELEKYIQAGYGILAGHDSIGCSHYGTGLSLLRKYFNIEVGYSRGFSLSNKKLVDYDTWWEYGSTHVKVEKNGLLTNFPYELPLGTELTIPENGIISQAAKGNVWMSLVNGINSNQWKIDSQNNYYNLGGTGNPKYYLTTYNNTAMLMTGHNLDGRTTTQSTSDERKVLANTLFYLKQRTTATNFTDNSGQDLKAPDKPTISVKGQDGNIVVNYKSEKDNGSTYSYYVESFDGQDASVKLAKSNERTETVTTGIKGYYYIIDDQETNDFELTRDESGNVTTAFTEDISLTLDASNHGKYIHVKAVDVAGNLSEVADAKLQKLILNTEVNLEAANGHGGVDLDWSTYDPTGKVFKAYQKKEGSEEFESISTIDLYDENAEPVKVLNVYPIYGHSVGISEPQIVTFRYLDGTTANLPKSASLKVWMEGGTMTENGNVTTFEAYGKNPITGKQLLNIIPVSSQEFNENPEMIWDYDVYMFGIWQFGGGLLDHPNDKALEEIEKYIKAGRGVLGGHDTVAYNGYDEQLGTLRKLRKYFNIDIGYYANPNINETDYNTSWTYESKVVQVSKRGNLTNFPYELPLGAKLTISTNDVNSTAAKGSVWLTFVDGWDNAYNLGSINNYYNAGGTGNPQYYLTTYNNTAVIQTGTSYGESTDDERKVLANTLFYLAQITKATSFKDNSAQDLKAPNVPTAGFEGIKETNDIKLTYNSEDNGSTYDFYVQALDENDTTNVIDTSNTRTETVTTGLKGYYYTIDENPENYDFDVTSANFTAESTVGGIDLSNNGQYVHVKAVDVAGNISEPTTVRIEVKSKVTVNLDGGKIGTDEGPIEKEGLAGTTEDIGTPEKEGYTFVGWETPDGIEEGPEITYPIEDVEITAKWEVNNYKYKVNYYYDNVLNEEVTVEKEAPYNSQIEEYETNMPEGYKFDKTENLPLTIGTIEENNIINVYYVADETKTKELTYTVEYYKNNEIVETDIEIVTETVQLLQPSLLDIDRTKANTIDKYRGYKLDKIQIDDEIVTELPETIETGKTIKIYYVAEVEDLVLDTKVNLEAANKHGGVDLDWNTEEHPYDPTDRIFRAFQKKDDEEGAEWESISTVDFYKEIEPIKVLNVYPIYGGKTSEKPPIVTFTYSDGTTVRLPKSAILKVWMEGGKLGNETFEPYAINPITGQKLLNITPMSSTEFGNNPKAIWDYDIVVFGIWNGNGTYDDEQYNKGIEELRKYIKSGYGVIAGHDSIGKDHYGTGLARLKEEFKIEVGYWDENMPSDWSKIDYKTSWCYDSTTVLVEKNGIITNFPYELPVGTKLTVPVAEMLSQASVGTTWMSLVDGIDNQYGDGSINNYYNAGGKGNPLFYLTTYNNTAMIMTGHAMVYSNITSTPDERKVWANTLFYLKQRTNATSFTDNSSQDVKAPDKPVINVKGQDGNIVVNYKSEKDNGSTYSFRVEAYDDQRADIKLAESNISTETVTTGIKGYYYVIDDQESNDFELIRDEEGNVTNATYTEGLEGISTLDASNHGKYIHVKAVDVAGNLSEVAEAKLQKLVLDTEVNLGAANGHGGVDLDWSNNSTYDATGKVFKAFQRKDDEEGSEFETISTVDFYDTNLEPIKVLNVYPLVGTNATFTYADGTTEILPKSASLKVWMEGGKINGETFEAYGKNPKTGQQLLNITLVNSTDFNNNPEMLWNYDIVMFGTWDANGSLSTQPNDIALIELEKYIKAGKGVLTGHDSIGYNYYNRGLGKLRKHFNIEIGYYNSRPSDLSSVDYNANWGYQSTNVEINRSGLITNFPNELPLGAKLTVPLTHTCGNAALGYVWMSFIDGENRSGNINNYYNAGGTGSPVYYLTTWNNTAMIQTGHSNCQATDDERKVLANTLFYLKQITKQSSFTDNSSQDVKAPNAPSINFEGIKATNDIKLTYNSEDNGSTYSFYVQALDENDTTNVIDTSNTRTETVTTGVDGYYYIIDENPENYDFDVADSTYTTESTANVDLSNNGKYVHMKAVDVAGNISEPTTVQIMIKVKQPLYLDGGTLNGEEGPVEKEVMPGVPTDLGLPEKEGYTFTGWEDPEGPIEGTEYTYPLEEVPITATWKANEYDYTVRHFEKGTTTEIATAVTKKADFASEILATDEAIEIDGFAYDSADKEKLTITTHPETNTIDIYYTRVNGLSYKVNYLEKDTNEVIYPAKEVGDQTFGKVINATDEVIEIEGYNYDSVDKESITVTTGENVLNIYYTKRNDLIYTVKYLEKDEDEDTSNNKVLATEKVVNNQTFKAEVTETAIDIEGYNKVEPTSKSITIEVEGNEIVFYYTKKTDLSYTVKYLEKDTNKELATAKTVDNQVFEAEVTEQAIDIVGYNKVDPTSQNITIGVNENVITFYYTKRNDLSYTVKYLEKDSNAELATAKTVNDQVFESEVTENAIDIEGYNQVAPTEVTITIGVNTNEITFYYTKKDDLSYTVKYLEEDSNKELADEKVVKNKTFQDVVTENAIDIEGYNKVDPTSQNITIGVNENIITFYYTKRTDLSYTVRYVEEKTNNELATPKVVEGKTFEEEITENAIDIVGYNKVDPTTQTIKIGVSGNEITFYYTKRNDLSYTVRYLEKDTEKELAEDKVVNNQVFESTVIEQAIDIRGYNKVEPIEDSIVIGVNRNEIKFYYTKRNDLSYTVQYLDEDTEEEIAPSKVVENQTFTARVTEKAIDIEGYNKVAPTEQTIAIDIEDNLIKFYYTKRSNLSYTVKYLEKDTEAQLRSPKVVNGQTYLAQITESAVDINGYNKVDPTEQTITIKVSGNEITFYYTKRNDLSYTVKYLEKDTKKVLADEKIVSDQVFGAEITESAIDIEGYDKVDPSKSTIIIDVEGNEIVFYYTKRTDLSYTVRYLEKDTDAEVADTKVVTDQVFETEITENAIDVEGYNKVDPISSTITIGVNKNEITFYYTKRNDLSYTVKYLEKDTNKELAESKVIENQVFASIVTEQAIDIEGYNKVDPTTTTITIGVNTNEIIFYYTKKADLSYTVRYLEQDTDAEVADTKVVTDQVFETEITENAIDIDGYNKVDPTSQTITIGVNKNEITFYYTKRNDLSYTVNYLEKDSNKVLSAQKVANNQIFGTVINAKDEVIEIDGYNYDSVDKDTVSVSTDAKTNVINIYYTKVTGLTYKVNYLDKVTNEVINPTKVQGDQVFENVIKASSEVIEISGYKYDSSDKEQITITTGENVLNLYYTKRTDLSYTVRYLEKDTEKQLVEPKVVGNQTFKAPIVEQAIDIEGYNKVAPLEVITTVEANENIITFYYTKRTDLSYTVKYLEQDTNVKIAEEKTVSGQVFESTATEQAIDIEGYNKVAPTEKSIQIAVSGNEIVFYYTKKSDLSYTVKYLEKDEDEDDTNNKILHSSKVVPNQVFASLVTEQAIEIEGYNKLNPSEKSIQIAVSGNEIVFYYAKRADLTYTVKYLEKDSDEDDSNNRTLHDEKVVSGQVFESTITENAIDIEGFNKLDPTEKSIVIGVKENIITFYYTKRSDLSYTVKYLEKDSDEDDSNNRVLHEEKVVGNQVFESTVTENAIDIEGYNKVAPTDVTITIGVSENEVVFYYTKKADLSYTVKYLEKDSDEDDSNNRILHEDKVVSEQIFESEITENAIDIEGFNKLDSTEKSIVIGVNENVITFYYTKRNDLSYTVKYLEKDADEDDNNNRVLHEEKIVDDQLFESTVTENAIDIEGFNKLDPTEKTIVIEVEGNEITFYYTKKSDLSYTVNYLEKDTNTVLALAKIVGDQVFESEVTEEAIEIEGYDKVDPTEATIKIAVSGNEITFYYTKRTDLSYTVKYLEQDTNAEVADTKIITGQVFESTVTESAIDVEGYDKVEPTEKSIEIQVSGNEIVFYYTKRADLSYIVKYLDEDTEEEIAQDKVVGNQVFKAEVTETAIDIEGYNKVDPTSQTIVIAVEGNEIKFYYTKRTDLIYTVKYLEQDTNLEVAESKTVGNKTLKELVTEKAIDVDGYNKVDPLDKSIEIAVSGNEIIFYYTKKADLSYTVKYLEKDTNTELATAKVVENQVFASTVTENAIAIDGYNAEEPTQKSIQIATSGNEITFYYTKRTDLSYVVNYLEKDTNIVLKDSKIVSGQTFGDVIDTIEEKVAISGYDFDSIDKESLTITTNSENNVINIFYTKGKFNYTVEYYYDNEIDNSKTATTSATFQDVIENYEDKNIPGYKLVNVEGLPLTVTEFPAINVIKVYYVKDIFEYTVNYYYDEVQAPEKTEVLEGVFGTTIDTYKDKVEYGYEVDRVENLPLTISKDPAQNVINVFYGRKDSQVTVKYVDKATGEEIAPEGKDEAKVFDPIDIPGNQKDIDDYTLIETPPSGTHKDEEQEIIYYYAKNTRVIVKYLEKESDLPVANEIIIEGYEGKDYTTVEQNVENYVCVDNSGELNGKMPREESTVIYYYLQNTKVVVNHIDQISGTVLASEEQAGLVGDEYTSSAKDFEGYVLVEKPEEETITMAKDIITLNYYYKKVSAGVIEKHIDIKTNELLDSTLYEGNEGDKYTTTEKSFYGYDIVADQMPENAKGEMTVEVIEVRYYYIRKASVKVEYIDKATNKTINETYQLEERDSTEYIRGYEGDPYKTVEKQFAGYDIVPELYPENAEGVMQVVKDKNGNIVVDSSGNAVTETVVRYYYAYKTEVKERHIDVKTGELLDEVTYPGHEGEDYSTSSKEIQGYDLVEAKLPINAKGKMTVDTITVDYYYIKNMTVRVEYIDIITNEKLNEKVAVERSQKARAITDTNEAQSRDAYYTYKDSTEIIKGHEGDEYKTTEKVFENYTIVKEKYPLNWRGVMAIVQNPDGTTSTETVVRYYYVHVSNGVVEKHIDAITGKELETETRYQGNEGDQYKTNSKEFKGYDLVTSRLPENSEGKMTKDEIVVKYYYIRKANVTIEYLEENTNNKIEVDKIIEGHEGERYYAEGKNIAGYEFVRTVGSKDGVLGKEDVVVKYYYKKIETAKPNNNTNTTPAQTQNKPKAPIPYGKDLPDTGDILPFVAGGVILLVAIANVIISIVKKRRNKN